MFGPFEKLKEGNAPRVVRLLEKQMSLQSGEEVEEIENEAEQVRNGRLGDLIPFEHVMVFYPKAEELKGDGIPVRKMMERVIGESEIKEQGTYGLQIWQGKVWWDTAVLGRELEKRRLASIP